jgi:hypothetical protein
MIGLCFLSSDDGREERDRMRCRAMEVPVMPEPIMTVSTSDGGEEGAAVKAEWGVESQNEEVGAGLVVGMPGSARMRVTASDLAEAGIAGEANSGRMKDIID